MSPFFRLFLISLLLIGCSHPSPSVDEATMALAEEGNATARLQQAAQQGNEGALRILQRINGDDR